MLYKAADVNRFGALHARCRLNKVSNCYRKKSCLRILGVVRSRENVWKRKYRTHEMKKISGKKLEKNWNEVQEKEEK